MESMTSQSIEEGNEDATVVVRGGGETSMRVDGSIETTWKHYMMLSGILLLMHSERVDIEGSSSSSISHTYYIHADHTMMLVYLILLYTC